MTQIKQIKTDKISEDQPNQSNLRSIPKHWSWVKLGDLIGKNGIFVDGDWVESKDQDPNGEVRLIQLADIGEIEFRDKSDRFLTYSKALELNCTFLEKDDLLIARMPDPLGRACLFPLKGKEKFVTVVDVAIVRVDQKKIDNKFLCYIVNAPQSRNSISELQSGSTRKRISRKNLGSINFPLPPLPEQKKIVEKIEELFSSLDSGVASLKKAKEQIRLYRQSTLAAAFSGRLTRKDDISSRDVIFSSKAAEPKPEYSNQLPDGWKWVKLGEVSLKITDGEHLRPKVQVDGIPFLSAKDVRENEVTFENVLYVSENDAEKFRKKCNPEKGDILIVSRGATVGRLCIIKTDKIFCLLGSVILIKIDKKINSSFIAYMIKSPQLNKQIINVSGSTAQQAIYLRDIKSVEIPLPPLNQQTQIVEEIEKRFSEADNLEKAIDDSLKKSEALRQSILKQAFEGRLV